MTTVSIIGTAGRSKDKELTVKHFDAMVEYATNYLKELKADKLVLVSGGAAWADHVAVQLMLTQSIPVHELHLHLPCHFDFDAKAFQDNGSRDWRINPGRTTNHYHEAFSKVVGRNSLAELNEVSHKTEPPAVTTQYIHSGFHQRNTPVAKSDHLLAFTWGKSEPDSSGTLDTWNKAKRFKTRMTHVCLDDLVKP